MFTENNTLKFYLNVKCARKPEFAAEDKSDTQGLKPQQYLDHHFVNSGELVWEPLGDQASGLKGKPVKMLIDNILIAKLAEGQEIEVEVYCTKNMGKVHTKWSPVSTAYYRLFPVVRIVKPVVGEDAEELRALCPTKVFDIEDIKGKGKQVERRLKVVNEPNCTMCRACINHERVGDSFELGKHSNHYHFTIESIGVISPEDLFRKALAILKDKAIYFKTFVNKP